MSLRVKISNFLDFFYPVFKRFMPLETFRYAACGGLNTLLGLMIYYISFYYLFEEKVVHFFVISFKPHNASLFLSGIVSFSVGFLLSKYVVFTISNLKGRIQLFRYFILFSFNIILNYFMLKMLVDFLGLEAFLSQLITTAVVIAISFFSQKHFTFKVK